MREIFVTVGQGAVGVVASGGGIYISILPQVEAWLRVSSLCLGMVVAGLTAFSLIRKLLAKDGAKRS